MELYEFKEDDAFSFARHVRIKAEGKGSELRFLLCPYCRGGSGGKDRDTFAISLKTGMFKCQRSSCGAHGNMITLSKDFDFSLGSAIDEYYRPKRKYRKFRTPKEPIRPKPEAVKYLESRGISQEIAERYEITTQTDRPNILVFPFYDEKGIMQFIKYRKTDFDKEKDKNKEWCEADCKPILFGMKQCKNLSRLVITEGQMDSLSVATIGIENAVSVPTGANGFTWIPYCWNWINQFEEVVVFGDYEKGKITLLDELSRRLKITVKHVREEDYKDCKDANEILQKYGEKQVRICVENSVVVPIKQVIPLSQVKNVDPYKIPKIATGIWQVDKLLYGGLPFGGVVIVSGKTGCGKSTLASQILINAIAQDHKCFAYSGELVNSQFKLGVDFQIAGGHHIAEYQNSFGDMNYALSDSNRNEISKWYDEKIWIYDNSVIEGDERENLLTIVENMMMQFDVRVALIDNLMTAMSLEEVRGSDKYEKQSEFVNKLAQIATRHNSVIILVAHKRKNNFSQDENDEVSGSGDIPNLATVIIHYDRGKDIEPYQRLCRVTKNRLFGKINTEGYLLDYDEKSRRIYGYKDDLYRDYGWSNDDGFIPINENPPFND